MGKKCKIAMVVLAAGEAKRMQGIKQLLPWKKTTLLGNVIEQGLQAKVDGVFVVLGANSEKIKKQIINYPIQIIENTNWENGLGSSIACSIHYFKENDKNYDAVLISLADQPLVDFNYLNFLITQFKAKKERIVTSKINNKSSVPVIFDTFYFEKLLKLNGDSGAKSLLQTVSSDVFMVNSNVNLVDIDTLEAYEAVYKEFGKR